MLGKISLLLPQGQWRKLSINVASLFSVQVANYLLPLLTLPYVSRLIGPERSGLLMIALGYNHYFVLLVNFGFDLSVVRLVATNRDNPDYINRIFSEVLTAKIILLLLAVCIFWLLALLSPAFSKHLYLNMVTCSYCLGAVLFPQWLYQGMEDLSRVAILSLLAKVLFTFGVLILIRTPEDYWYQNMAGSVGHIIVSIIALVMATRRYKLKYYIPTLTDLYQRYKDGVTLFFSNVVTTLYSSSHALLISFVSTAYAVGIFTAASRLELIVRSFIYLALNQALFPIVAKAFGEDKEKGIQTVRRIAPVLLIFTMFISICMFSMAPIAVNLLYGNQFDETIAILRILSLLPILLGLNSLLGIHTFINLKMDKEYLISTICVSIAGIVITVLFTKIYGAIGAATAWVIIEIFAVLFLYFVLESRGIEVIRVSYFRLLLKTTYRKNIFKSRL